MSPHRKGNRQRRPEEEVAFRGVTVGQVDDSLRPRAAPQTIPRSHPWHRSRDGQPHRQGRIADRLDKGHGFGRQPRRLAQPGLIRVIHHQPRHGDGQ